jgi:hypothetical protein
VPHCPPQTPHAARRRTRAAAVGSQRVTAWAAARPSIGQLVADVPSGLSLTLPQETTNKKNIYAVNNSEDLVSKMRMRLNIELDCKWEESIVDWPEVQLSNCPRGLWTASNNNSQIIWCPDWNSNQAFR